MTHTFRLPIGDWSKDGHGDCDWFDVKSNKPVQEVRESYFAICEKLGTGLDTSHNGSPCAGYEDYKLSIEWLTSVGLTLEDLQYDDLSDGKVCMYGEAFAHLFIVFMNKHDPSLELILIKDNSEMFPFYGYDDKKRHIGFMGYGCTGNF